MSLIDMMNLSVLAATSASPHRYECSGVVRRAFRARGFDAWSCDIQTADDGSPYHLQGDVWAYTDQDWT